MLPSPASTTSPLLQHQQSQFTRLLARPSLPLFSHLLAPQPPRTYPAFNGTDKRILRPVQLREHRHPRHSFRPVNDTLHLASAWRIRQRPTLEAEKCAGGIITERRAPAVSYTPSHRVASRERFIPRFPWPTWPSSNLRPSSLRPGLLVRSCTPLLHVLTSHSRQPSVGDLARWLALPLLHRPTVSPSSAAVRPDSTGCTYTPPFTLPQICPTRPPGLLDQKVIWNAR